VIISGVEGIVLVGENEGGRCGAEGRFFKEKAPQKPFWEKVF
jgi:hypothetical protein